MESDDIATRKDLVQTSVNDAMFFSPFRCRERIVGEHIGLESAKDLGNNAADPTSANDADGFAAEIKTDQAVQGKIMFSHAIVSTMNLPVQREQKADGMFCHCVRGIGRHAA